MIGWMLYATVVGAGLGVAALLAEGGVRRLGLPVRWVWVAAMVGTVLVPVALAVALAVAVRLPGDVGPVADRGTDTLLLVGWALVTLILLTSFRISVWTLQRNARSWRPGSVDGQRVLVSTGLGPGVIGARRPQVVLPAWVVQTPERLRRLVVRHEVEHVRAGDGTLLLAGIVATLLVPWCLPLWWQLHRLRAAVETDCDNRVMAGETDARAYANALVAIAGRPTRRLLPVPTLAPRTGELERRIRLITGRAGDSRRGGLVLVGVTLAVLVTLAGIPAPSSLPAPLLPALRWSSPDIPPELPREAKVFLSVEGGR